MKHTQPIIIHYRRFYSVFSGGRGVKVGLRVYCFEVRVKCLGTRV